MRTISHSVVVVVLAALFLLAGCAMPSRLLNAATQTRQPTATTSTPATVNAASTAAPTPAATDVPPTATDVPATATDVPATSAPAATSVPATATAAPQASTAASAAVSSAIKAVIQRANDEQVQAFVKNDPTVMKDTATSSYYNELVQTNLDLANGGVTAIKLVKLEWGPITLQGATNAQVTTFETWQTSYDDGSTDQSRDRNIYTMVKEANAWKIQEDAHPDSGLDQQPGGDTNPTAPVPVIPQIVPPGVGPTAPSSGESRNWSGYVATKGTYTSVTGTWTVPQPTSSGVSSSAATWVGIGGAGSRDLIQAGTEEIVSGGGQVRYGSWIELLPQASHTVSLSVGPGDSVTATITQQSQGQWLISIKNNTSGKSYQTNVQYASSLSSAEWIEEAPSGGNRVVPLENFGTVQFTSGSAVKDGKQVSIAQSGARPITMYGNGNQTLASPSVLSSDGGSFSVTRSSSPALPAQPFPGFGRFPRGGGSGINPGGRGGFTIVPTA